MAPLPKLSLPGFQHLHNRVSLALDTCEESQSVDFMESQPWPQIRYGATATVLGMGNLRDGGLIIIGVSQRGTSWRLDGVKPDHLNAYNIDVMKDQIDEHVSPYSRLRIGLFDHKNGRQFVVMEVGEFDDLPLVCKKNGPNNSGVIKGGIYVRPPRGRPKSTRVMNAIQMQDLLELATEKRVRKFLEITSRVGIDLSKTLVNKFDEELQGL